MSPEVTTKFSEYGFWQQIKSTCALVSLEMKLDKVN